jgi:hypothetical protein
MGITEEAGAVAAAGVSVFGRAPMLLALTLLNLATFGMTGYLVSQAIESRGKMAVAMIEASAKQTEHVNALLAQCRQ